MPASRLRVTPLAQIESARQAESASSQTRGGALGRHCGASGKRAESLRREPVGSATNQWAPGWVVGRPASDSSHVVIALGGTCAREVWAAWRQRRVPPAEEPSLANGAGRAHSSGQAGSLENAAEPGETKAPPWVTPDSSSSRAVGGPDNAAEPLAARAGARPQPLQPAFSRHPNEEHNPDFDLEFFLACQGYIYLIETVE
ncbi:hypothetical protein H8959_013967 [Pygathrix nigripes]